MATAPLRILFLCTGNSCRSQMAEGWMNALRPGEFTACSAGTEPGTVNPRAIAVMAEVGVDISGHRAKPLTEFLGQSFDYIVTLCDTAAAACPAFPGNATRLHLSLPDPAAASGPEAAIIGTFQRVRDVLRDFVRAMPDSLTPGAVAAFSARAQAEHLYATGQYLCSEAVFLAANAYLGKPVSDEMVRLASGFPVGMGTAGCTCGALSGGVMALGLKYGRTTPGAAMPEMFPVAKELHDRFKERRRSTCCRVLIKDFTFGSPDHLRQCITITGEVARDVIELLTKK